MTNVPNPNRPGVLAEINVVEFNTGIAGSYATKLFADLGAKVTRLELTAVSTPEQQAGLDYLNPTGSDGLYGYLTEKKELISGSLDDPFVANRLSGAHLVVESATPGFVEGLKLHEQYPSVVILSITPFGHTGPWAHRPATEFTLQAECGSIASRGWPDEDPIAAGGRIVEWVSGAFAAAPALAAILKAKQDGVGTHIDLSMLECGAIATTSFQDALFSVFGRPPLATPARMVDIPCIEPSADGWVGFAAFSAQQFQDFCAFIEQPQLSDDPRWQTLPGRLEHREEWDSMVHPWTRRFSTQDLVDRAALFRMPASPVCNGETVLGQEHLVARGVFNVQSSGVCYPRPPVRIHGIGSAGNSPSASTSVAPAPRPEADPLPLAGVRVLELTGWWAGPAAGSMLAALGADVIRIESIQRPDGTRMMGVGPLVNRQRWWELSGAYLSLNYNKRAITLDLESEVGKRIASELLAWAHVLVENFSPRVLENMGLSSEAVHAINPRIVMVRMPAFGLDGPWRDRGGFAHTLEQLSGMAWITGSGDQPMNPRGPCDPLGGAHAAFAALVGLQAVAQTGRGTLVEVPLIECALNVAAEQVIQYSSGGMIQGRHGNRSPLAAPQGIYRCMGWEQWLAVSIASDDQWCSLKKALGDPQWVSTRDLESVTGRFAHHDLIDGELAAWAASQDLSGAVEHLVSFGVPAGALTDPRDMSQHPQLTARGFLELCEHPVAGSHSLFSMPFRLSGVTHWIRSPAPTLGQHNLEVIGGIVGLSTEQIGRLETEKVIGDIPANI